MRARAFLGRLAARLPWRNRPSSSSPGGAEPRRAEHNARFLASAGAALAEVADTRGTLQRVARLAVPLFADWCAVDMLAEDGTPERVAATHVDAAKADLVRQLLRRWPLRADAPRGLARALRDAEPQLIEEVTDAVLQASVHDAEQLAVVRELGLHSYICVPVRLRQQTLGALTFVIARPGRRYDPADLRLAEDLSYRVAIAVENARLYEALRGEVAERRRVEAELRLSHQVKDEFLATLSHELRTPLNAIVGWTHILRETMDGSEQTRRAVEAIHRNAQAQAQLVADILDVSRIIAGKLRLKVGVVALSPVIEAAVDTVRPASESKGVRLEVELDRRVGPISGDPDRLQQVVWNLVSNAIKFVPAGQGWVRVRLEVGDLQVRLTVEDNGPGIAPDFLPYVFERFRQSDSSVTRRHHGLGLGLAIVRHLVELHGGSVRAANREDGPGAVFTVELPRWLSDETAAGAGGHGRPRADEVLWLETAPSLHGLSVLVVDDEADSREVLKAALERCGAEIVVAGSAREALALLDARLPHVVVSDLEMPEESGYDFIRQLRARDPERGGSLPVAALTAYAGAQDRVRVLSAGFQVHVPKPVLPAELAVVVASLARGAAAARRGPERSLPLLTDGTRAEPPSS